MNIHSRIWNRIETEVLIISKTSAYKITVEAHASSKNGERKNAKKKFKRIDRCDLKENLDQSGN